MSAQAIEAFPEFGHEPEIANDNQIEIQTEAAEAKLYTLETKLAENIVRIAEKYLEDPDKADIEGLKQFIASLGAQEKQDIIAEMAGNADIENLLADIVHEATQENKEVSRNVLDKIANFGKGLGKALINSVKGLATFAMKNPGKAVLIVIAAGVALYGATWLVNAALLDGANGIISKFVIEHLGTASDGLAQGIGNKEFLDLIDSTSGL